MFCLSRLARRGLPETKRDAPPRLGDNPFEGCAGAGGRRESKGGESSVRPRLVGRRKPPTCGKDGGKVGSRTRPFETESTPFGMLRRVRIDTRLQQDVETFSSGTLPLLAGLR